MLEVTFVRRRGSRDRVYVSRADGTTVDWAFPSYGDGLPHDLCHLVVEDGLALTEGFWGLVDQGVEVALVNNQATLVRDGTPLTEIAGANFSGLMQAEMAVASLGSPMHTMELSGDVVVRPGTDASGGHDRGETEHVATVGAAMEDLAARFGHDLPTSASPEVIAAIHERLRELGARWRALPDGGSIVLPFQRRA
jgi:hypothetical protein